MNEKKKSGTKPQRKSGNRGANGRVPNARGFKGNKSESAGAKGFPGAETRSGTGTEYTNDPSWYASDPALMRDAASIPYSWATGTTSSLNVTTNPDIVIPENQQNGYGTFAAPGILTIRLRSTLGVSNDSASPINMASAAIYSFVRHANSGHANYDPADLTLYLIGIGEIIAYVNFLIRVYGAAGLVSSRNRYMPKTLVEAMGVNYEDLLTHLAEFRLGINMAINKLSSFAAPANFTYFKRKAFLYSGIYTEGSSMKDQLYMYTPAGFMELNESATVGEIEPATNLTMSTYLYTANGYTVAELLARLNRMIGKLTWSEDFNIMSGDIYKAYGEGGIFKFAHVDEQFTTPILFDIAVLEQMKNATICRFATLPNNTVTAAQDDSKAYIISYDSVRSLLISDYTKAELVAEQYLSSNRVLTTTTKDVDPSLTIESTRLMTGVQWDKPDTTHIRFTYNGGTEIAVASRIYAADNLTVAENDTVQNILFSVACLDVIGLTAPVDTLVSHFRVLASREAFKFCPGLITLTINIQGAVPTLIGSAHAIAFDNYAVLTYEDLRRMHEACILNMMRVPAIGSAYSG